MTTLTKILLVLALILLLLTSVFIGLFAGAEHKLKQERNGRNPPPGVPITTIIRTPHTTITTTTHVTSTVPVGPIPTGKPEAVSAKSNLHFVFPGLNQQVASLYYSRMCYHLC